MKDTAHNTRQNTLHITAQDKTQPSPYNTTDKDKSHQTTQENNERQNTAQPIEQNNTKDKTKSTAALTSIAVITKVLLAMGSATPPSFVFFSTLESVSLSKLFQEPTFTWI